MRTVKRRGVFVLISFQVLSYSLLLVLLSGFMFVLSGETDAGSAEEQPAEG
jgi:hypothetical protein